MGNLVKIWNFEHAIRSARIVTGPARHTPAHPQTTTEMGSQPQPEARRRDTHRRQPSQMGRQEGTRQQLRRRPPRAATGTTARYALHAINRKLDPGAPLAARRRLALWS